MNGISSNSIGKSLLSGVDFKIEIVVYRNLKFSSQFKVSVLLYENIFYQKKRGKGIVLKSSSCYKNSEWMACVQELKSFPYRRNSK